MKPKENHFDLEYYLAEKVLEKLWLEGLISDEEKVAIHQLNLEKFTPFLAELLA